MSRPYAHGAGPGLTVRVRLTLLFTGLFAACGAILVAIMYALVASEPVPEGEKAPVYPDGFLAICKAKPVDEATRLKCEAAFSEGVAAGAQEQRDATLAHLLQYSLLTLAIATLLAAVAGWIVAGRVLRPVQRITAAARSASDRNLTARVGLTGPRDELRELADTFDAMLDRLQAAFESQGRFIANAGHELRTPLTVMRTAVDVVLAKPDPTPAELREMGREVQGAVMQTERLIAALLTLARNERGLTVREEVDLATAAEDAVDAACLDGVRPHLRLEPAPTIGDPILLERLIANLVENGVHYNVPGGELWVVTTAEGDAATVTVANTGPLLTTEAMPALFAPFQRLNGRTADGGLGLGLTIVASIAAMHRGNVTARPRPDGGLVVTVTLARRALNP
jgi:signal transduction histidine kinase